MRNSSLRVLRAGRAGQVGQMLLFGLVELQGNRLQGAAIKANKAPRAILVVICWDPREAARCRRVIPTGHPGFDLYPIVVDPRTFPSWEGAGPYLVILAGATRAIDLATPRGRDAVLTAIGHAGASHADTAALSTIILGVADAAARAELEVFGAH